MPGNINGVMWGDNISFSLTKPSSGDITTDGALIIGSTGNNPQAGTLSADETMQITNGSGTIQIGFSDNAEATGMHGWNGSVLETNAVTVTSDGATITFSVEQSGGGDLTIVTSNGFFDWDTSPPDTISLTAGTDVSPQINFIYWLESTQLLTVSTSSFPSAEHAPLATVLCQSAASLQTDGAYKVHVWTDHVTSPDDQGHMANLNRWIRDQNATWLTGVDPTLTITTNGGAPDNVIFTSLVGTILQLHEHSYPVFSGTPDIYTVNDFTTPFNKITDLNALLTDSQNVSMSGRFFSLVIWGVVSEDNSDSKLMVNLPSGSYNNQSNLLSDEDKLTTFTFPPEFKGTGFLIAQLNLRHRVAASGTWTEISIIDLRGQFPSTTAGGSLAGGTEFPDNTFRILDDSDATKEIAFQASGISTATTRTITMADRDLSLDTPTFTSVSFGDEALSTYNEGTFTPVLTFGGASVGITYGTQTGVFTQIGDLMHIIVDIVLTSKGSSNGDATITGLPSAATAAIDSYVSMGEWNLINLTANYTQASARIVASSSIVDVQEVGDNVAVANLTDAEFADTTSLQFQIFYKV